MDNITGNSSTFKNIKSEMIMNNKISPPQSFSKIRFEMTSEALAFLLGTTKGIINWHIYYALLNLLCVKAETIMKRGIPVSVVPGQVEACANSLRAQFNLGQKAMVETLNKMHRLGLINWHPSKVASLAEMTSVLGWYDGNGEFMENSSLCSVIPSNEVQDSEPMSQAYPQSGVLESPQETTQPLVVETPQLESVESLNEEQQCQESDHEDLTPANDAEPAAEDIGSPSSEGDIPENTAPEEDLPEPAEISVASPTEEATESENAIFEPSATKEPEENTNEEVKDTQSLMRDQTGKIDLDFYALQQSVQNFNKQKPKTLKDKRQQNKNKA